MAKAVAVALLAIVLLAAGSATARPIGGAEDTQRRNLLGGPSGQASAFGGASGFGDFSQSFSNGNTFAGPGFSGGSDLSANVAVKDGKPSFSASDAFGASFSGGGQSHSNAFGSAFGSSNPGSSSNAGINVGSSDGKVGSSAGVNVGNTSGR